MHRGKQIFKYKPCLEHDFTFFSFPQLCLSLPGHALFFNTSTTILEGIHVLISGDVHVPNMSLNVLLKVQLFTILGLVFSMSRLLDCNKIYDIHEVCRAKIQALGQKDRPQDYP